MDNGLVTGLYVIGWVWYAYIAYHVWVAAGARTPLLARAIAAAVWPLAWWLVALNKKEK